MTVEPQAAIDLDRYFERIGYTGGESHVADVGFGGLTLTAPLRLEVGVEQETPHETFRIAAAGPDYLMQAKVKGEWKTLYRFDLQRQFPVDYEMSNYHLSTNDRSHFRQNLLAARAEPGTPFGLVQHPICRA